MSDDNFWPNRRIDTGFETAEALAACYNRENWRAHPENQRAATEDSLDTLGLIGQIKKSTVTGLMFDGHLRVELALLKNPQMLLPVDYYDLDEDETALALQVHDAITEQAQPIPDKLAALMERTREMTAERPGLRAMLEALKERAGINGNGHTPEPGLPPVDKAEELQAKWQVQPGQIWQMGDHFIICGDCREPETWQRLLDAAGVDRVNGVFTSPPYAEQRKQQYGGVPTDEYVEWWGAVQTNVRAALAKDGSFFVNIKPHCEDGQRVLYVFDLVLAMVRQWGWWFIDELCWKHPGFPLKPHDRFSNAFEPIYQFSTGDFKFFPDRVKHATDRAFSYKSGLEFKQTARQGYRDIDIDSGLAYPRNVIEVNFDGNNSSIHAAAFPVALPTFFIRAYSDEGDSWLDPFLGSGTTIVACENEKRIGLGIERLPKYCAVILERLETMGIEPRLTSG